MPSAVIEYKEVAPTFSRILLGRTRPAIVVTNKKMPGYKMFIICRDYGTQLDISWYLVADSLIWMALTSLLQKKPPMDLFQMEELGAWVATVHHATIGASEEIAEAVNFDFSKVDQISKGFLNIS